MTSWRRQRRLRPDEVASRLDRLEMERDASDELLRIVNTLSLLADAQTNVVIAIASGRIGDLAQEKESLRESADALQLVAGAIKEEVQRLRQKNNDHALRLDELKANGDG